MEVLRMISSARVLFFFLHDSFRTGLVSFPVLIVLEKLVRDGSLIYYECEYGL